MSAAGSGEEALESNSLKSGVFTHHLISALRGAADRDADGRVTLHEAYEYAYSGTLQTSSRTNERLQHPTISFAAEGAGPLVLTRIAPARSLLTLPAARDEQYVVFEKGTEAASPRLGPRPSIARRSRCRPVNSWCTGAANAATPRPK